MLAPAACACNVKLFPALVFVVCPIVGLDTREPKFNDVAVISKTFVPWRLMFWVVPWLRLRTELIFIEPFDVSLTIDWIAVKMVTVTAATSFDILFATLLKKSKNFLIYSGFNM